MPEIKQYTAEKQNTKWIRAGWKHRAKFIKRLKHSNTKVKLMLKMIGYKDVKQLLCISVQHHSISFL